MLNIWNTNYFNRTLSRDPFKTTAGATCRTRLGAGVAFSTSYCRRACRNTEPRTRIANRPPTPMLRPFPTDRRPHEHGAKLETSNSSYRVSRCTKDCQACCVTATSTPRTSTPVPRFSIHPTAGKETATSSAASTVQGHPSVCARRPGLGIMHFTD
jgi:hypothetical protein